MHILSELILKPCVDLWLISTAGPGFRFGLRFQTLWLHSIMQKMFLLTQIQIWIPFPCICIVRESLSEFQSKSASSNGNKPLASTFLTFTSGFNVILWLGSHLTLKRSKMPLRKNVDVDTKCEQASRHNRTTNLMNNHLQKHFLKNLFFCIYNLFIFQLPSIKLFQEVFPQPCCMYFLPGIFLANLRTPWAHGRNCFIWHSHMSKSVAFAFSNGTFAACNVK